MKDALNLMPMRILHLEDDPADAELVERELLKGGLSCVISRVATRETFVRGLADFSPDIVLIDYTLPDFDGLTAVKLLRERDPDLPAIVVTGALGDETAVELVKAGARDYILKDRLARLPFAVTNALAEIKQARARREAETKITVLARSDPLTGLANRPCFLEHLEKEFALARRSGQLFAVMFLDLDGFKDINDSFGHLAGDKVLRAVAKRLLQSVRKADVTARFGGDEFVILQSGLSEPADAGIFAARLMAAVNEPYSIDSNNIRLTMSVGIALFNLAMATPDIMLEQADLALYRAKDDGRNRYCFHTPELDAQVRERVQLSNDLRLALERHEFELCYQPEVSITDGRIIGLEALLRWNHPQHGRLPPAAFIFVAERIGLMTQIGEWLLANVCSQIAAWRGAGLRTPVVGINLSTAQLKTSAEFERILADALTRSEVSPEAIELELDETGLAHTAREYSADLKRVRLLGVRMAIDNFGAGASSLSHFKTYNFSRLKIGLQFVQGATKDKGAAAVIRAAVALARELGVGIGAEGVETREQLEFLASAGCPAAQGSYLCPPLPPTQIGELLRKGKIPLFVGHEITSKSDAARN